MTRRFSFRELFWPDEPEFSEIGLAWADGAADRILDWTWRAFDELYANSIAQVNLNKPLDQLERDLTGLHFAEIQRLWAQETGGHSAFYPGHEIHEFESRSSAQAQPPTYDLGFVLYQNPRVIWPIEAKVVGKPTILAAYLGDVRGKFAAGIAAPFVGQAGMIGYLLTGSAHEVFAGLAVGLGQTLGLVPAFCTRGHRTSFHVRGSSPFGRDLPDLLLHHLIMNCQ